MSIRSHTVLLAFAIVFTMGMALAVAILCIPPAESAEEIDTAETTFETPPATDTAPEETIDRDPILPDVSNGLQFTSLGNGTCMLSGIGVCRDACVVIPEYSPFGDLVIEIAPRALYGIPTVTAIQIPASVRVIGELAFAACENLMYISVNDANPYFCDDEGVLYTVDLATLLLYPPMRAGTRAIILPETVRIADMAFFGCIYLSNIHYHGSPEQWEQISIGVKNYSLTAAAKTFEAGS